MLRLLHKNLTTPSTPRFLQHLSPPPSSSMSTAAIKDPSLTLYFLQNSCNLPHPAALSAASKIHLKNTNKPRAVLSLLKSYGFSDPHITRLVSSRPKILLVEPAKTLKPKLDFYLSLGLGDLPRFLSSNPPLLLLSIANRLSPNIQLLKSILHSDGQLTAAIKSSPSLLRYDLRNVLLPKVEILRQNGVSEPVIVKLCTDHPKAFTEDRFGGFEETFAAIKEMGFRLSSPMFAHALGVLSKMTKPMWERKLENYRSLGWSDEEVIRAFTKHPYCMSASVEKVRKNMEFLARELKLTPANVSSNPSLLSLSFEKRIVPRFLVIRILESVGLAKGGLTANRLMTGEKEFMRNYVVKYQSEFPQLVDAITGKMGLEGLDMGEGIDQKEHPAVV